MGIDQRHLDHLGVAHAGGFGIEDQHVVTAEQRPDGAVGLGRLGGMGFGLPAVAAQSLLEATTGTGRGAATVAGPRPLWGGHLETV